MLISESQEVRLGREAAPSMEWEFGGQYHDPALETYLGSIVKQIWQNSERSNLPFRFYIQNTSLPNAFALPGYVAITRGLLSDLDNEAQFAAIMGHETGHVMARHTAKRLSQVTLQQLGLAIGGVALAGEKHADTLLTIGAIGSGLVLLKYSRSQEIQSDRLGVKYMSRLGYDPNEALSAHKALEISVSNYMKLQRLSRSKDNFMSNILSTHPRTKVRLEEIQAMINDLPPYTVTGDGKFKGRFQKNLRRIKDINKIYFLYDKAENNYKKGKYNIAEQQLQKAIELNNRQAPFYNLLGFLRLQQKKYSEAGAQYKKALTTDPGFQPSIYGLGLVHYFQKEYRPAITEFKKSLKLYPGHPGTHFGIGKSYFSLHQYQKAIKHLKSFAGAVPDNPEVHGLTGICYENTGNIGPAISEYRLQVKIAPNTELGIHAKKRLAALEPVLKK